MEFATSLTAQVKLVVWDLDDTFWEGTLGEGAVVVPGSHPEIVRELNRRGIVSSICSKNDFESVERRLRTEGGVWDEFVFPRIAWEPKGQAIARLIEDMQLRPANVLFIDDNEGNLREARHYTEGLQTAGPEIIPDLLGLQELRGKDDATLSRLNQYRILQTRLADQERTEASNEDFLRSCAIQLTVEEDCSHERHRLLELINRTNQLNYTKRRLTQDQFDELLDDSGRQSGYVRVSDRYGDYDVCGFYSIKDGALTDFVFSCRILNMGVENWLYRHLGSPTLTVNGPVVTELDPDQPIDWINTADVPAGLRPAISAGQSSRTKVLIKGGCDLIQVNDFLDRRLDTEFSYTNDNGAYVEWHHIEVLRRSHPETMVRYGDVIDRLPFIGRPDYSSRLLAGDCEHTHVVLSLLNEYGQGLYQLRGSDFAVPYGQYYTDITDERNWEQLTAERQGVGMTRAFLAWFAERFEFRGPVSVARFEENVRWLAGRLPSGTALILINGAEVDVMAAAGDRSAGLHLHQRAYNEVLADIGPTLPNVRVCDVRPFIRDRSDVTFNTRHYTRLAHLKLAEAVRAHCEDELGVVPRHPAAIRIRRVIRRLGEPGLVRLVLRASRQSRVGAIIYRSSRS